MEIFLDYLKVFAVGGALCALGQLLINKTQMSSARILVTFMLLGVVLELAGAFSNMKEFASAGVTIPITGFGSGLARGVFLPEAAKRSGSLITAELALEQGKDVFIAPGNIFAEESGGTNLLLQSIPHALVLSPDDILAHYRMTPKERVEKGETEQMTLEENLVIAVLRRGEAHFEELLAETGLTASALTDVLVGLELSGIAEQTNGNYYSLC